MKTTHLRKTFGFLPLALCFLANALAQPFVPAPKAPLPVFSFQEKYKEFPAIEVGKPVAKKTLGSFRASGLSPHWDVISGFNPNHPDYWDIIFRDRDPSRPINWRMRVGDYTAEVDLKDSPDYKPNARLLRYYLPDGAVLRIALARRAMTWSLSAGDSIREMPELVESTNPPEPVPMSISIVDGEKVLYSEDAAPLLRGSLKYSTQKIAGQTWRFASVNVAGSAAGLVVPAGKIKLWHAYDAGGAEEDALKQAVALLKIDQPKLEVVLQRVPFGELDEPGSIFYDWNEEVADGEIRPDLFTAPNDHTGAQARLKLLAPLDRYLRVDAANFFPRASFEGAKVGGKIYGVPGITKAVALYYNKDTIPTPPATTAELLQMVKDGKKIAINQTAYHNFGFFTGAFGGTLLDANGVCIADKGGFAEALQFLKELKDAGAIFNTDDSVSNQLFTRGDVDMIIQGPWKLGDFKDAPALGDANLGVAKMPAGPAGASTPLAGVDYWYVNPNISDKQKKLAVAVALYLFGPKGSQIYSDVARSPMVTLGVQPASERVQTFADAAAAGFPRPQSTEFGNYWGPFGIAINKVLNDGVNPVAAVQEATQAMNAANGK
jgi:arabinogalactan oligomer/maltooligosaccharide transport system substrate-binding protein